LVDDLRNGWEVGDAAGFAYIAADHDLGQWELLIGARPNVDIGHAQRIVVVHRSPLVYLIR
jgi:hypothetical protein